MKVIKEEAEQKSSIPALKKYGFYVFKKKLSDGRVEYTISQDNYDLEWVEIEREDGEYAYYVQWDMYADDFLDDLYDALEEDIVTRDGKEYIKLYLDGKEAEIEFPTDEDVGCDDRIRQYRGDGSLEGCVTSFIDFRI